MGYVEFQLTDEEKEKIRLLVDAGLYNSEEEFIKAAIGEKLKQINSKTIALERAFGAWGPSKESGVSYVRKIRDKEERKLKRLHKIKKK